MSAPPTQSIPPVLPWKEVERKLLAENLALHQLQEYLQHYYKEILKSPHSKTIAEKWIKTSPPFLGFWALYAIQNDDVSSTEEILLNKQNWNVHPPNLFFMAYLMCLSNINGVHLPLSQYQKLLTSSFHPLLQTLIEQDFMKHLGRVMMFERPKELVMLLNHPLLNEKGQNDIFFNALINPNAQKRWEDTLLAHPLLLDHFASFVDRNKQDYSIQQCFFSTHDPKWENIRQILWAQKLKSELTPSHTTATPSKKM